MDITAQCFAHFPAAHVGNSMQSQTVVQFVDVVEILPDTVDDEVQELMLLMEEECDGKVTDLLLRVFGCGDEIDRLEMAEVDIPSEYVCVQ